MIEVVPVCGGQLIGTVEMNQIKLSIEYADSLPDFPKFMHPRAFFSLLFWREECDPVYNASPNEYDHPLLWKMMDGRENGMHGNYHDDDWLGLRPPLRIYKRVEWEARLTHELHHADWQTSGSLSDVLRNPLIGTFAAGRSKCNLFVGEMAFRSGFRTFVGQRASSGSQPLYYLTGTRLVNECTSSADDDQTIFSGSMSAPARISWCTPSRNYDKIGRAHV